MSRAFVKEDIDVVERVTRRRSPSGLPPGAVNYLTEEGARELRRQLEQARSGAEPDDANVLRLKQILASATVVKYGARPAEAVFGSTVSLRQEDGGVTAYRIVGVDEVEVTLGGVSWISPLGRALLQAKVGQPVRLPDSNETLGFVVSIE